MTSSFIGEGLCSTRIGSMARFRRKGGRFYVPGRAQAMKTGPGDRTGGGQGASTGCTARAGYAILKWPADTVGGYKNKDSRRGREHEAPGPDGGIGCRIGDVFCVRFGDGN